MESLVFPTVSCAHQCTACSVRSLSLCAALEQSEMRGFERLAHQMHLARKESLFQQDELVSSVYNLNEGVARLYKLLPDGRRQIVGFALPGDFLGLTPNDCYSFSADAIGAAVVCRFSKTAFLSFVESKPRILRRMNEFTARELSLAQDQMLLLGRRSAEEKVAAFLVGWRERTEHHGMFSKTLPLPMSRQDIADFLGLTIETVSRTFTKLERSKMIVIVPGGIRLLDSKRVEAMAAA
ncbi:MAG: helix-turn-helix domain-containing protein [Xanthobacteraceae bacterium]|nr:helix-turn-helix domain-containing protein [Xanthobacteraceae bacterium]